MFPSAKTSAHRHFVLLFVSMFLAPVVLTPSAIAQEGPAKPAVTPTDAAGTEITAEALQARIKQVEESQDLDETVKKKLLDVYNEALVQLKAADDWTAKAAEFEKERTSAPARLKAIKEKLAEPVVEPKPEIPPHATLADLDQRLSQAEAELADAKKEAADLTSLYQQRDDRQLEIPKLAASAKERLEEAQQQSVMPPAAKEPQELIQARQTLLAACKRAARLEVDAYNAELLSYDARGDLLTARRDQAARRVAFAGKLAQAWRDIVNEGRRKEAEKVVRETQDATKVAKDLHPSVLQVANVNAALAAQRTGEKGLAAEIEEASQRLDGIKKTLAKIEADFQIARKKVKAAGLTEAMGVLLRKQRDSLPSIRQHRRDIRGRDVETSKVQLQMIEHEDRRAELVDIEDEIKEIEGTLGPSVSRAEREEIEGSARKLLLTRRELLESLIKDYDSYFAKLIALNADQRQLIVQIEAYLAYIDEQIFWFPSTSALRWSAAPKAWAAFRWMAGPARWGEVARAVWVDARETPWAYVIAILAFVVLLALRPRIRARLRGTAALLKRSDTDRFAYTVQALGLTLLIALFWPAPMWFLGWRLRVSPDTSDFAKAVGAALHVMAVFFLAIEILRKTCLRGGLGEEHFRWDHGSLRTIRKNLVWLTVIELPMMFIIEVLDWEDNDPWTDSLGRLAFIVAMVALSVFSQRVLRPQSAVMQDLVRRSRGNWAAKLRHFWYAIGVAMPIGLAAASALGYHYTAVHFENRLIETLVLALGVLLANAMMMRWLFVLRRRLALREAQERRGAEKAPGDRAKPTLAGQNRPPSSGQGELKLHEMNVEAQKLRRSAMALLLFVGLYVIWIDVLPALGILNRVELWSIFDDVAKEVTRPDGTTGIEVVEQRVPITLADIAFAGLIVILTVIAARNVPGLLEMTFLQRLGMDYGVMYAISSISTYIITVVGIVIAFCQIGIGWSKVQWLVAAMTVGLGFGLQEIFANFVSGLIILFERPMRVGDVVTVGDITGAVTNIRIRATTITDWDRKELVVPNKEFITGRLVNWTLSDSILRVVIPVGIAYGSDTDLAKRVLLDVARESSSVLTDPEPSVLFMGFGDSTYDFELWIYVPDVKTYFSVRHDINNAIKKAFDEAHIEMAFPQRDIHIRSIETAFPIVDKRQGQQPT